MPQNLQNLLHSLDQLTLSDCIKKKPRDSNVLQGQTVPFIENKAVHIHMKKFKHH